MVTSRSDYLERVHALNNAKMAEVRDQIEKSMAAAEKRGNESFSIPSLGATVGDSLQEMVLQDYREAGWTVSMEGCGNERYITFE